jgi:hypothetical protein
MGREIRMVPPNWNHPRDKNGMIPMFDQFFEDAHAEWLESFDRIRRGELTETETECYTGPGKTPLAEWLRDEGVPPNPAYYRPWRDEGATWYQVWETITEGTPVTPPFSTLTELADHLATYGDDWSNGRPYTRAAADAFVKRRWVPSMMIEIGYSGTDTVAEGIECAAMLARDR